MLLNLCNSIVKPAPVRASFLGNISIKKAGSASSCAFKGGLIKTEKYLTKILSDLTEETSGYASATKYVIDIRKLIQNTDFEMPDNVPKLPYKYDYRAWYPKEVNKKYDEYEFVVDNMEFIRSCMDSQRAKLEKTRGRHIFLSEMADITAEKCSKFKGANCGQSSLILAKKLIDNGILDFKLKEYRVKNRCPGYLNDHTSIEMPNVILSDGKVSKVFLDTFSGKLYKPEEFHKYLEEEIFGLPASEIKEEDSFWNLCEAEIKELRKSSENSQDKLDLIV